MSCGAYGGLGVLVPCTLGLLLTLLVALAYAGAARRKDPRRRWARWLAITLAAGGATLLAVGLLLAVALGCSPALSWWLPLLSPVVGLVVASRALGRARARTAS